MVRNMQKLWVLPVLFSFFLLTSGCNESGLTNSELFPEIISTTPAANAESVAVNSLISVTFSESMDSTSIHGDTFIVKIDTLSISGTFSYTDLKAVFTPSIPLGFGSIYSVGIKSDVQSLTGTSLENSYEWSFSTEDRENSDLPQILSTNPANNTKDVLPNSAIKVSFNKPMNSNSLNTSTFTVYQGSTPISGLVTSSNSTATFSPFNVLNGGNTYRAFISSDVEDTLGNALENDFEWSFKTLDEQDNTPPQVQSVSPSSDERDLPVDVVISASFNKALDNTSVNSSTFLVTQNENSVSGSISLLDSTISFTPNDNLPLVAEVTAVLTTGIKDEAGNSLPANYEWSFVIIDESDAASPEIISINPTPNATHVDVVSTITATFNEPMNESTINNSTIIVSAGNSISGNVSYSDNKITFSPHSDLRENTTYTVTITTGVENLEGNGLENNFQWSFTTDDIPEETAPQVQSVSPADEAGNIPVDVVISAFFNKALDNASLNSFTILVFQNGNPVSGNIGLSGSGLTLSFTPDNDLPVGVEVEVVLTNGIKDEAGNSLEANYEWSFETVRKSSDNISPEVLSISPADNAKDVDEDAVIRATFSEPMNESTINNSTFIVRRQGRTVSGDFSFSNNTVTFTPNRDLRENRTHTVTITTGVEDLAGNALESEVSWNFRTEDDDDD